MTLPPDAVAASGVVSHDAALGRPMARALVDAGMDAEAAALDLAHLEELDVVARVPIWAELAQQADL